MQLPYVIDNRAHNLADVLNALLHSDAVHALDVTTATLNVGVTHLPESCTELRRSKKSSSAQALSLKRRCSSFREGRGEHPELLEPKVGLEDLTGIRNWIKSPLLVNKYIGIYPPQW